MKFTSVLKYVLKVWGTTLLVGSILAFTILSTFTSFASEIRNPIDLFATSLIFSCTSLLITVPVAFIFYTLAEVIVRQRFSTLYTKSMLILVSIILTYLVFLWSSQQGSSFLWIYSSITIFFYSFLAVQVIAIVFFEIEGETSLIDEGR